MDYSLFLKEIFSLMESCNFLDIYKGVNLCKIIRFIKDLLIRFIILLNLIYCLKNENNIFAFILHLEIAFYTIKIETIPKLIIFWISLKLKQLLN